MNLYEPYIETTKADTLLHLTLSRQDRVLSTIISRILPLLILALLVLTYVIPQASKLQWVIGGILLIVFSILITLNVKKGMEISFKKDAVEICTFRVYGIKKETILLNDAEYIDDEIYKEPRVSGSYYRLALKNGKRVMLLRISGFLNYDEARFTMLNKKLEEVTGLQVRSEWKGIE